MTEAEVEAIRLRNLKSQFKTQDKVKIGCCNGLPYNSSKRCCCRRIPFDKEHKFCCAINVNFFFQNYIFNPHNFLPPNFLLQNYTFLPQTKIGSNILTRVVNHSKSSTEAISNTTKTVFHYLVRFRLFNSLSIECFCSILQNLNLKIEFKVWSFKNMVIMDKLVSPWPHNEKYHAVNKQEASESA